MRHAVSVAMTAGTTLTLKAAATAPGAAAATCMFAARSGTRRDWPPTTSLTTLKSCRCAASDSISGLNRAQKGHLGEDRYTTSGVLALQ